jgi:hypothetical protein
VRAAVLFRGITVPRLVGLGEVRGARLIDVGTLTTTPADWHGLCHTRAGFGASAAVSSALMSVPTRTRLMACILCRHIVSGKGVSEASAAHVLGNSTITITDFL